MPQPGRRGRQPRTLLTPTLATLGVLALCFAPACSLDNTHRRRLASCSSDSPNPGFDCFVGDCADVEGTDVDDAEQEMAETTVACALAACARDPLNCIAVNSEATTNIWTSNPDVVGGTGQGPAVCYVRNDYPYPDIECDESDGDESDESDESDGEVLGDGTDGAESTGARLGAVAAAAAWLMIA